MTSHNLFTVTKTWHHAATHSHKSFLFTTIASEWIQVVFSNESRFNFSSYDNRVCVWRPRGERFNPAFALQRHITSTADVIVWGVIAYNTWSPLVLIRGTMIAQRYVHDILQPHVLPLMQILPGAILTKQCSTSHSKGVTRLYPHCYSPSLARPNPGFVSNRAYLRSFGTASWASHEFE
ncbi:transposable element Tcb1 transposase [Trichonephila clavipes]|nr:transposable element Tcb1 transposase [Trichonephila clavipes]